MTHKASLYTLSSYVHALKSKREKRRETSHYNNTAKTTHTNVFYPDVSEERGVSPQFVLLTAVTVADLEHKNVNQ